MPKVNSIDLETLEVTVRDMDKSEIAQAAADAAAEEAAAPRRAILLQIATLETSVTPRRMREAALTDLGKAWLSNVDNQITALRAQL